MGRQDAAAARARCGSWAAAAPRTSCSRPSRRSRKCSGSPRRATTTSSRVTDARPDTGGLSGATPAEAVSWGKIDPDQLPGTVICYCRLHDRRCRCSPHYALARARAARPASGSMTVAARSWAALKEAYSLIGRAAEGARGRQERRRQVTTEAVSGGAFAAWRLHRQPKKNRRRRKSIRYSEAWQRGARAASRAHRRRLARKLVLMLINRGVGFRAPGAQLQCADRRRRSGKRNAASCCRWSPRRSRRATLIQASTALRALAGARHVAAQRAITDMRKRRAGSR